MLIKLVLDTSVLISAFFWEGNEAELFRKIEQGKVKLYISKEILSEVEDVIKRPKFKEVISKANITTDEILQKIIAVSNLVVPSSEIDICRDKADNKFLECAVSAKVDYIVTGDKDLLSLKKYNNIFIVRTSKILRLL